MSTATDARAATDWLHALGTLAAGAVGFAIGFYVGLFVILSIWGLDAEGVWYPVSTLAGGSLVAGLGAAATVSPMARRVRALGTALAVGALALGVILAVDGDFEALWIAGLVVAVSSTVAAHPWPVTRAS